MHVTGFHTPGTQDRMTRPNDIRNASPKAQNDGPLRPDWTQLFPQEGDPGPGRANYPGPGRCPPGPGRLSPGGLPPDRAPRANYRI